MIVRKRFLARSLLLLFGYCNVYILSFVLVAREMIWWRTNRSFDIKEVLILKKCIMTTTLIHTLYKKGMPLGKICLDFFSHFFFFWTLPLSCISTTYWLLFDLWLKRWEEHVCMSDFVSKRSFAWLLLWCARAQERCMCNNLLLLI